MTIGVVFHELAEAELNEAAAYYAHARPGLGEAFVTEVRHAVDRLAASPLAGGTAGGALCWWPVKRFPYSVLYRVRADHIRILAIAHQRRRPLYWRGRR